METKEKNLEQDIESWLLSESITPWFLLGTILILTGLYFSDRPQRSRQGTPVPGVTEREMRPHDARTIPSKDIVPTIRFSNEDRMVEGELFGTNK